MKPSDTKGWCNKIDSILKYKARKKKKTLEDKTLTEITSQEIWFGELALVFWVFCWICMETLRASQLEAAPPPTGDLWKYRDVLSRHKGHTWHLASKVLSLSCPMGKILSSNKGKADLRTLPEWGNKHPKLYLAAKIKCLSCKLS